jgi:hypothetical protein
MATTTPNYGWAVPTSTDLVKDGATAIETLGDAIDASMNTALGTKKAGMVLLNTTSFSAVSSVSVPANTFSATYDNYVVRFNNLSNSGNDYCGIRLRAAGVDDSGANYRRQVLDINGTAVGASRTVGSTSWLELTYQNTSIPNIWTLEIQNPFLTEVTTALSIGGIETAGNPLLLFRLYGLNTTTSYDAFTLIAASGTITGSISVYGFNK